MKLFALFSLLVFVLPGLSAQNLVFNPSFEELEDSLLLSPCRFVKDGRHFSQALKGWSSFSDRTPDLIIRKDYAPCLYPTPRTGHHLVGLITYLPRQDTGYDYDYHEYIQGTFRKPLVPGQIYRIEFWLSHSDSVAVRHLQAVYGQDVLMVSVAANRIGLRLLSEPISPLVTMEDQKYWLPRTTAFEEQRIISSAEGEWVRVTGTFVPDRTYLYFLVGNFGDDENTRVAGRDDLKKIEEHNRRKGPSSKKVKRIAYYCIDDVAVYPEGEGPSLEEQLTGEGQYVFRAVNFWTGSAELLPEAFSELDALAAFLADRLALRLEIAGHTDNVGSAEDNARLSEQRARSVRDYLVQQGVAAERLQYRGVGEEQPVADNDTPEGRRRNRRVECRVINE